MIPLNDLSRKSNKQLSNELKAVETVLLSGHYLKGEFTKNLENVISNRIGKSFVLGLGNGTDALRIAMQGLGLSRGNLIAVVPNAGGYATTAAKSLDLNVGLVDVNEFDHQMSEQSLKDFLQKFPNTRAVVLTHLYGIVGQVHEINELCKKYNVLLIEDCAQSFGAEVNGNQAGGFGDAATFSFYPTKNLGSAGDAGAVAFSKKEQFLRAKMASQYGWGDRYSIELTNGINSRIDEIQAALLLIRELGVDELNLRRRQIISGYRQCISEKVKILGTDNKSFVGHLAVVESENRAKSLSIFQEAEIETAIHYPILDSDQPAWVGTFANFDTPIAKNINKKIFTIPCFPELTENEINRICETLKKI